MRCDRRGIHKGQERKEILQLEVKSEKITDAPRTEILFERLSKRGIMLTLDTHACIKDFLLIAIPNYISLFHKGAVSVENHH